MTANAAHDLVWSGGPVMARNAALALKFGVPGVTAAMMVGGAVSQVVIDGRYDRLHTPETGRTACRRGQEGDLRRHHYVEPERADAGTAVFDAGRMDFALSRHRTA
ncbi:hypothetical protein [Nocardia brasiliensis]